MQKQLIKNTPELQYEDATFFYLLADVEKETIGEIDGVALPETPNIGDELTYAGQILTVVKKRYLENSADIILFCKWPKE